LKTLIVGLGNEILGDEGVGVHAARALESVLNTEDAQVLEVGTAILDALPDLEHPDRIIVIDAMKAQGTPGTIYRTCLADCSGAPCIASMHGFDIFRVLSLAGRTDTPQIVVFGVEPLHIGWSTELSEPVRQSMPPLISAVQAECRKTEC
jgi:hydrogenase maturation protease